MAKHLSVVESVRIIVIPLQNIAMNFLQFSMNYFIIYPVSFKIFSKFLNNFSIIFKNNYFSQIFQQFFQIFLVYNFSQVRKFCRNTKKQNCNKISSIPSVILFWRQKREIPIQNKYLGTTFFNVG